MTIVYVFTLADIFGRSLFKLRRNLPIRRTAFAGMAVLVCLGAGAKGSLAMLKYVQGRKAEGGRELGNYKFKKTVKMILELPKDQKGRILANPDLTYLFEILADNPVYIDEYFLHCITSSDDLFKRWALLGKTYSWSGEYLRHYFESYMRDSGIPFWPYGLPASFSGMRNRYQWADNIGRIQSWVSEYDSLTFENLFKHDQSRAMLPKLLLQSPNYTVNLKMFEEFFQVELVGEVPEENTKLWSLKPRLSKS